MYKKQPKKFKGNLTHTANPLQENVLNTLKYRQIFNCPMNVFQIWNYYIGDTGVASSDFLIALNKLVEEHKITLRNGFYSINPKTHIDMEKKIQHSRKLISRAKVISLLLKKIPWIEMISITGSVAAFNAEPESDIDLLIVTRPQRLWITRLFLVLILKITHSYWTTGKQAGKICPNILMTLDNMTWDKRKRNLYSANEVSLVYPIVAQNNCYLEFLAANAWVKAFLPNFSSYKNVSGKKPRNPKVNLFLHRLINLLDFLAMKGQLSYMSKKRTTETVTSTFAHFNKNDFSTEVLTQYAKQCHHLPERV